MSKSGGFAHILILLLLITGLGVGLYLVQNPTFFQPRAASNPISGPITASPMPNANLNRVFVTSTTYNGNLGGLVGADQKCQDRAVAANLGGTWKAWLSASSTSAASRLTHSTSPYKLINGTTIANNWDDLIDGSLNNPPRITELGQDVGNSPFVNFNVWTNSQFDGRSLGDANNCNNFTDTNGSVYTLGSVGSTSGWWSTMSASIPCTSQARIYCFEQPTAIPSPTPAPQSQQTVTFNNTPIGYLNGQMPVGLIDWGKNSSWNVTKPYRAFTTRYATFGSSQSTSGTFRFVVPATLVSLDAINTQSGSSAKLTISCAGQPSKVVNLPSNKVVNVKTGWTGKCNSVTVRHSNGYNRDAGFDNLVIKY